MISDKGQDFFKRFAKLERVNRPPNKMGFKLVKSLMEVTGTESIIIAVNFASFYKLYDIYEGKCEYKIYNTEDACYWCVEVESQ